MKELLLETAKETGLANVQELAQYFQENNGNERIDEVLLRCPFFTEDSVLRLFAAALGWDFVDMGYRAGKVAIRVKNGENPADIPIQYMSEVMLYLNLNAAEKQGVKFSEDILKQADEILMIEGKSRKDSTT